MKAFISDARPFAADEFDGWDGYGDAARHAAVARHERAAVAEAKRILAETEPDTRGPGGVRSQHYVLDSLGYAGRNLAEAIAAFVEG